MMFILCVIFACLACLAAVYIVRAAGRFRQHTATPFDYIVWFLGTAILILIAIALIVWAAVAIVIGLSSLPA